MRITASQSGVRIAKSRLDGSSRAADRARRPAPIAPPTIPATTDLAGSHRRTTSRIIQPRIPAPAPTKSTKPIVPPTVTSPTTASMSVIAPCAVLGDVAARTRIMSRPPSPITRTPATSEPARPPAPRLANTPVRTHVDGPGIGIDLGRVVPRKWTSSAIAPAQPAIPSTVTTAFVTVRPDQPTSTVLQGRSENRSSHGAPQPNGKADHRRGATVPAPARSGLGHPSHATQRPLPRQDALTSPEAASHHEPSGPVVGAYRSSDDR